MKFFQSCSDCLEMREVNIVSVCGTVGCFEGDVFVCGVGDDVGEVRDAVVDGFGGDSVVIEVVCENTPVEVVFIKLPCGWLG
ncbi:hypothetical protein BLA29_001347 [Euroglyphus maynei]|uniref:Uncharacterized protein n=1 Tax=Euroglyphus maynei TaxID=6958 RepID=A0A1Y3AUH2_EURMA|nr:hypothetical protein BLA29_001347 [Euroglyphus maynei]